MLPCLGGTTTVVYNTKEKKVVRQFLSLVGTLRNCAGGPTPWNSWISCEEVVMGAGGPCEKDHGWCFEVPASEQARITPPVPLKAMGRFNHEAIAVDPYTGDVFMTEDRNEGLIYKFTPTIQNELDKGGTLYALKIKNHPSFDTRNWSNIQFEPGQVKEVEWIKMTDVESPKDDLRFRGFKQGAACFARGEGMWYSRGNIYFACTNGGPKKRGQIWRMNNEKIELFVEPNDPDLVDNCDNLTVSPSGDLFICEDGKGEQYIDVITPNGEIFKLAKNTKSSSELSGPTFSPDGSTLFVNMQHDGLTLAITGPWDEKLG
jgi:secreted PhoX family phosphatase